MPPQAEERHSLDAYDLGDFPLDYLEFFNNFNPPADITIPVDTSTANVGLSAVNNQNFAVGFQSPPLAVPQFSPGLPLTEYEDQPDPYSQPAPADPIAGGSESKNSESKAKVLKYYYENFKHSQPFLQVCDQRFRAQVGSFKTSQASLKKRKDDGHWVCPLECTDFTRKQNLKRQLLFLLIHFCDLIVHQFIYNLTSG